MAHTDRKLLSSRHVWNIILYRASAELRAEASRTYAGYLWWVLQPLLMFFIYYIAFAYVMPEQRDNFAIFLFTGIILWQWFSVTVLRCSGALIASKALMQQVYLPKSIFPLSIIAVNLVKFAVSFVLLCIVLMIAGFPPTLTWISLPLLLGIELLIICSLGCFSAMLSPFIPDYQYVLATVLQLMFFVSGIIYDLSILPDKLRVILELNPMAIIISQTRDVLMYNTFPDPITLAIPILESLALLYVSLYLLKKFDKSYPKLG